MTAQVPDLLLHAAVEYCLLDTTAGPPFDPVQHGFSPVATSTACWRGHVSCYTIEGDRLLLRSLAISHGKPSRGMSDELWPLPVFHGVAPQPDRFQDDDHVAGRLVVTGGDCAGRYDALGLELVYDGMLLIGTQWRDDGPRFTGTVMPWEFHRVSTVALRAGRVQAMRDVSAIYETLRSRYMSDDWLAPDQRRNARRFLRRQLGTSFSL